MARKKIAVRKGQTKVTIEHPLMRFVFDVQAGAWSVYSRSTGEEVLRDARFRFDSRGDRLWPQPPTTHQCSTRSSDKATTLTVKARPDARYRPVLEVRYTFRPDRPAIEIGWSVHNTLKHEIRVRDIEPVYDAILFPEQSLQDPRHLVGGAGAERNLVQEGWDAETLNSLMVTGRRGRERRSVVAGGLRYREFARTVEIIRGRREWGAGPTPRIVPRHEPRLTLAAWDPVGKRIAPGVTWRAADSCYLDLLTVDPFDALEAYGLSLRAANKAAPHPYDFPTLCGWMVSTVRHGEGKPINNSAALVEQMELAREKGLTKYTPLAPRLEPDYYCHHNEGDTQQGWYDDEHFARYGSLTRPYDTFAGFCAAVAERGGIPFTYMQVSMPSNDFALAHPDWMLGGDISELHRRHSHQRPYVRYDYSHPGFQEHMRKVWAYFKAAGLKGVKFDYPETGWNGKGGFKDPAYTTTSAYRKIFELCKEGLGKDSYVHERILGAATHENVPRTDVTAGIVDLQRIWGDAGTFEPEMASRMGLRWYKSRAVFHYYPDGKSFLRNGKPLPRHERRAFLSLIGFLGGRLEIGTSIGTMTDEMLRDMTRLYPIFPGIRSPRPVDMLTGKKHPEVYSYEVTPDWRQVLLVNNGKRRKTITTPLSASHAEAGGLQLDGRGRYHAFDFWNQTYLGRLKGSGELSASLRGGETAMISLRRVLDHPQVISTNRHIMQGMVECHNIRWSARGLTGAVDVIGGEPFVLTIARNGTRLSSIKVNTGSCEWVERPQGLMDLVFTCEESVQVQFTIR